LQAERAAAGASRPDLEAVHILTVHILGVTRLPGATAKVDTPRRVSSSIARAAHAMVALGRLGNGGLNRGDSMPSN
jgi:hypothetical protein